LTQVAVKLSGSLGQKPLVETIGWIYANSGRGKLTVKVKRAEYLIYFLRGMPVFAESSLASDNIFEVMVSLGQLDRDRVPALRAKAESGMTAEKALLETGEIEKSRVFEMRRILVREIIIRACGHREGEFKLEDFDPDKTPGLKIYDINPMEVISEAVNRYMLAQLPEKFHKISSCTVQLNPQLQKMESVPEIFYRRTYLLDEFQADMLVQDAIALLAREFKDLNQAMTFLYLMYVTGVLLIHEKPELKPSKPRTPKPSEKVSSESGPRMDSGTEHISVSGKRPEKKKAEPAKSAPEPRPETPQRPQPEIIKLPGPPVSVKPDTGPARPGAKIDLRRKLELIETKIRSAADVAQLFGIKADSPEPEIERAFFKLMQQFQVDEMIRSSDEELRKRGAEVKEKLQSSMQILTRPEQRDAYEKSIYRDELKKAYSLPLRQELARKQFNRGKWFLEHHRPELALERFEQAVELDPEKADYFAYVGWAMYRASKGSRAQIDGYLKQALQVSARSDQACYFLGLIRKDDGDEELARDYFQRALSINPENRAAGRELDSIIKHQKDGIFQKLFSRKNNRSQE